MKKRTILVSAMAAVLALSSPVSASTLTTLTGKKSDIAPYKAAKTATVTMLFSDHENYPYKSSWGLFKELEKITNVKFNVTTVPRTDYVQKRDLLIASAQAPDIIPKMYPGEEVKFVSSGVLLPVSKYFKSMPNFTDKVDKWKLTTTINNMRRADNELYVLPGLHEVPNIDYSLAVRTDVLEKNKIATPDTWDQVYDMLKAIKKVYPNLYPFSDSREFKATMGFAAPTFGVDAGWADTNLVKFDWDKDEYYFHAATNDFKAFVTYFNKLVKEGLLDPESFTQTQEVAEQKLYTEKTFVQHANSQDINRHIPKFDELLGTGKAEFRKINVPAGPKGAIVAGSRTENGVSIMTKATKNKNFSIEELFKLVDYVWYSDEMQLFTTWGYEGTHYEMVNGAPSPLLPYQLPAYGFPKDGATKDLRIDEGFSGGVFSYAGSKELRASLSNDIEKKFKAEVGKRTVLPEAPNYQKAWTDMESERANLLSTPLVDYIREQTLKFILGTEDIEKGWDGFVSQLKAKNYENYTKMVNDAYKKTKK